MEHKRFLIDGPDYGLLPEEMRSLPQWCLAGADKSPKMPIGWDLRPASPVTGPWLTFDNALLAAHHFNCRIGFIITADDPFTCIDLDVKDVESSDAQGNPYLNGALNDIGQLDEYAEIAKASASYTELSASGKGVHIWVRGDIGGGRRSKGIEIYSRDRFIVCTGLPVSSFRYRLLNGVAIPLVIDSSPLPIKDGEMLLNALEQQMGKAGKHIELEEIPEEESDHTIWNRAAAADNGKKFIDLCEGRWQKYPHYPSASEADYSLLSMFTFYSESNEQCRRMFRQTVLGQRIKQGRLKATDAYLNRALQELRHRQATEKAAEENRRKEGETTAKTLLSSYDAERVPVPVPGAVITRSTNVNPEVHRYVDSLDQGQHTKARSNNLTTYIPEPEVTADSSDIQWAPRRMGKLQKAMYNSLLFPVPEIAICASMGLMAGVTGKAYMVNGTHLNLYITLVGRSAIGKEGMKRSIAAITSDPEGMAIRPFIDGSDIASGPALRKAIAAFPSFLNQAGEFGHKFKEMSTEDSRNSAMMTLRKAMLEFYDHHSGGGGIKYSDAEKNVTIEGSSAFSILGETTPGTYYEALSIGGQQDGWNSRFLTVHYDGDRPHENYDRKPIPVEIIKMVAKIAQHAMPLTLNPTSVPIEVKMSEEVKILSKTLANKVHAKLKEAGDDESIRQVWNRAQIKVNRLASLCAILEEPLHPVITKEDYEWATSIIQRDIDKLLAKAAVGEIGEGDDVRQKVILKHIDKFMRKEVPPGYRVEPDMIRDGIIPRGYLQKTTGQNKAFYKHKLGSTKALNDSIDNLVDIGILVQVSKTEALEKYSFHGKCYRLVSDIRSSVRPNLTLN